MRHSARSAVPTLRTMADEGAPEPEPDLDLDIDPADDSSAVMAAVGRQIKLWREAAGMRAAELGAAIGYGEDLVYKVEGGRRIPKPEFLDATDRVVGARGKISAMKQDVAEARYPKKVTSPSSNGRRSSSARTTITTQRAPPDCRVRPCALRDATAVLRARSVRLRQLRRATPFDRARSAAPAGGGARSSASTPTPRGRSPLRRKP